MGHSTRLEQLRLLIANEKADGFILPVNDAFMGEYVPESDRRLKWLTGFSGSAGMAVVLKEKAAFFTDGRYTLQAKDEVDTTLYEHHNSSVLHPSEWLKKEAGEGTAILYDPWLHTPHTIHCFEEQLREKAVSLRPVARNLVDMLWENRPEPPRTPILVHPLRFAGQPTSEKIAYLKEQLHKEQAHALLITAPDAVCWLLNIRGSDVPCTPFCLSYALVEESGGITLFTDSAKVTDEARQYFTSHANVLPFEDIQASLEKLREKTVWIDESHTPIWFISSLMRMGAHLLRKEDPCMLAKACKNPTEIEGMRACHKRDGVAVAKLWHWVLQKLSKGETVTELSIAEQLLGYRKALALFQYPSFDTIAGFNAHGAIVHYHASEESNATLTPNGILLLDSGGQYLDGTTDITRTFLLGHATDQQKEHYTRVLKGHIALALALFPKGTVGMQLDTLARLPLWEIGLDYDHGTGHGVGSYLSVHEGPQRISKAGKVPLKPGMILSNEPGYYRTGEYGIRLENLVLVVEKGDFLGFETITCAPFDTGLITASLLTEAERTWLNTYHAWVRETLLPQMETKEERMWLQSVTAEF